MLLCMSNTTVAGVTSKKTADIPKKKVSVPKSMHDLLVKFADNPTFQLAVLLLFCRSQGSESYFHEYISALPGYSTTATSTASSTTAAAATDTAATTDTAANLGTYDSPLLTTPLYWDELCLNHLRNNLPTQQLVRISNSIRASLILYIRLFNELSMLVKDGKDRQKKNESWDLNIYDYSWEMFKWSISIVMSRQNVVPTAAGGGAGGGATELALIPVWDLMNHAVGMKMDDFGQSATAAGGTHIQQTQTYFNDENDCIEFRTPVGLPCGWEITMFYGPRSNIELLTYSGFAVPCNPYDIVDISLQTLIFRNEQLPEESRYNFGHVDTKYEKIKQMLFNNFIAGQGSNPSQGAKYGWVSLQYPMAWKTDIPDSDNDTAAEDAVVVGPKGDLTLLTEVPFGFIYSCYLHICSEKDELSHFLRVKPSSIVALFNGITPTGVVSCINCALTALEMLERTEYLHTSRLNSESGAAVGASPDSTSVPVPCMSACIEDENWCYVDAETTTARSIPNSPARPLVTSATVTTTTTTMTMPSNQITIHMMNVVNDGHVKIIEYYKDQFARFLETIV